MWSPQGGLGSQACVLHTPASGSWAELLWIWPQAATFHSVTVFSGIRGSSQNLPLFPARVRVGLAEAVDGSRNLGGKVGAGQEEKPGKTEGSFPNQGNGV